MKSVVWKRIFFGWKSELKIVCFGRTLEFSTTPIEGKLNRG